MIVREPGRHRWVVIDQAAIRNPRLSHRARGVLVLLLSMPDDWTVNAEWIAMHGSEGRDAVRSALTELERLGHLIRHKSQDAHGRWSTTTVVYEQPVDRTGDNTVTDDGFPGVGFPGPIRSTDKEVLTKKTCDMTEEQQHDLCTTCTGTGLVVTMDLDVERCHVCGGDGIGPTN